MTDKLYTTEAIQEAVNAKSEALKERDRLGYAVVKLVEAVDALLEAGSDEYLHDENGDFTYEEAPSDYWADLRTAADNMVLRAEDFEEKYRALMESPHTSLEEPACDTRKGESRCNRELKKMGKLYPRTCRECGLGQCKLIDSPAN